MTLIPLVWEHAFRAEYAAFAQEVSFIRYASRMAGVRTARPKVMTALRIPPDDLEEIRRRAEARGITVTQLLVDAALERLPEHTESLQQQIDALTASVRRLEQIAFE